MSVPSIEGFTPFLAPTVLPTAPGPTAASPAVGPAGPQAAPSANGVEFASMLSDGIERLEGLHDRADQLAVQAATGDLSQLHDYTITATEAAVTTQLTTAVRNKALEAFQEIMRMSV